MDSLLMCRYVKFMNFRFNSRSNLNKVSSYEKVFKICRAFNEKTFVRKRILINKIFGQIFLASFNGCKKFFKKSRSEGTEEKKKRSRQLQGVCRFCFSSLGGMWKGAKNQRISYIHSWILVNGALMPQSTCGEMTRFGI